MAAASTAKSGLAHVSTVASPSVSQATHTIVTGLMPSQSVTLTIEMEGLGSGEITSDEPGITCTRGTCAASFTHGTIVTGNGTNDSSVLINIDTIAPGETVKITYETVVCICIQYPVMIASWAAPPRWTRSPARSQGALDESSTAA